MFERTLDQPGVQSIEIERCCSTKLQVGLHMELMIRLGSPPTRIQGEHTRINLQLLGHERDNLVWGRLEVVRHKSEIPEDTQLEGIAQAILGSRCCWVSRLSSSDNRKKTKRSSWGMVSGKRCQRSRS